MTDSICAHENPLKLRARICAVQSDAALLFPEQRSISFSRACMSGYGTVYFASNRPGRIRASSSAARLFVAARTRIPSFCVNPSSSFRSAVTIRVFSVSIAEPE